MTHGSCDAKCEVSVEGRSPLQGRGGRSQITGLCFRPGGVTVRFVFVKMLFRLGGGGRVSEQPLPTSGQFPSR